MGRCFPRGLPAAPLIARPLSIKLLIGYLAVAMSALALMLILNETKYSLLDRVEHDYSRKS